MNLLYLHCIGMVIKRVGTAYAFPTPHSEGEVLLGSVMKSHQPKHEDPLKATEQDNPTTSSIKKKRTELSLFFFLSLSFMSNI